MTALHVAAETHGKATRTGSCIDNTQTILALLRRGASLNTGVRTMQGCIDNTQTILALLRRGATLNTGVCTMQGLYRQHTDDISITTQGCYS